MEPTCFDGAPSNSKLGPALGPTAVNLASWSLGCIQAPVRRGLLIGAVRRQARRLLDAEESPQLGVRPQRTWLRAHGGQYVQASTGATQT